MFKMIVLVAAIVVITTQWNDFNEIVNLTKIIEVTGEVITKVKE
jgi:hypothetical protein|tara:strand:- start:39 stop:170 length:132 start_codon:yes stop_codon:yes gene_type:complete